MQTMEKNGSPPIIEWAISLLVLLSIISVGWNLHGRVAKIAENLPTTSRERLTDKKVQVVSPEAPPFVATPGAELLASLESRMTRMERLFLKNANEQTHRSEESGDNGVATEQKQLSLKNANEHMQPPPSDSKNARGNSVTTRQTEPIPTKGVDEKQLSRSVPMPTETVQTSPVKASKPAGRSAHTSSPSHRSLSASKVGKNRSTPVKHLSAWESLSPQNEALEDKRLPTYRKGYFVSAGCFADRRYAMELLYRIREKHVLAYRKNIPDDGQQLTCVLSGPIASQQEAEQKAFIIEKDAGAEETLIQRYPTAKSGEGS